MIAEGISTINFINVSCGYQNNILLNNLDISFTQNNCFCILGPNGVGKTTLIKTLLRQLPLIHGKIMLDNNDINKYSKNQLAHYFSYVPQVKSYSFSYNVLDIVLMGRTVFMNKFNTPNDKDIEIAKHSLALVGMDNRITDIYSQLSSGEQQMVLLARAICQESKFMLLDEPTSNLDYKNQKKFLELIIDLKNSGKGIIMVSHDPNHAEICSDYTLLLQSAECHIIGKTDKIITTDNLRNTYGIDVRIHSNKDNSKRDINFVI